VANGDEDIDTMIVIGGFGVYDPAASAEVVPELPALARRARRAGPELRPRPQPLDLGGSLAHELSVAALARRAGMSERHFARAFRA
jgi:AraC-like DNA-binding protein